MFYIEVLEWANICVHHVYIKNVLLHTAMPSSLVLAIVIVYTFY